MFAPTIEFWIGYGSTYSYLSVMRIERIAEAAGVTVDWKPFNIRAMMIEKGLPAGPFVPRPEKLAYMWRDLERRAMRRGLPYAKPSQYPVDTQKTVRVAFLAAREGWCGEFSRKVFEMNFVEGRSMGAPGNLEAALREIGADPERIVQRAHERDVEDGLMAQTRRAIDLGMFGSPHFRVGEELFWGDDRLEDAIEWCRAGTLSVKSG
jgi:2-hydroxychromene-2-carboxylate isomerase